MDDQIIEIHYDLNYQGIGLERFHYILYGDILSVGLYYVFIGMYLSKYCIYPYRSPGLFPITGVHMSSFCILHRC